MGDERLREVDEVYQAARAAIAQYRLADARRHLDEAKRRLGEVEDDSHLELALRMELTESWLTCDESGLPAALAQIEGARARAEAADRNDLRALAHIQAGVLCARAGRIEEALMHMRPAARLSNALPVDDRVRLLLNKGAISSQSGHLAEAATDLATAAKLAVDLPDYAFMALHNLGFVEYLRGDLAEALRVMLAADDMDVQVERSVARLDRARVLMEVGLLDDAAGLLATTVASMRTAAMADELTDALLDEARCALLRGRRDQAVEIAEEVMTRADERGDEFRGLAAALVRLEALVTDAPSDELIEEAARLMRSTEAAGLVWLADRAGALGMIAASQAGQPAPDGVHVRLGRMRRSPYLATRLLAIQASLSLTSEPAQRTRLVRTAVKHLSTAKAGMASLDLRTAATVHIWPIVTADLEHAVAAGSAWKVLDATERWRAALEPMPSVAPPSDPEVAALWSTLRRRHGDLRDPDAGDTTALHAEVTKLERQLRERSWAGADVSPGSRGPRLRRENANGHVLLSYFWLAEQLHLIVVEPNAPARRHVLGERAEVAEALARVSADASALARTPPEPLAAAIRSSLEESLSLLDAAILPPSLAEGPVVIVPSGTLARLPWGMLPRLRGRGVTLSRSLAAWQNGATVVEGAPSLAVASGPDLALAEDEVRLVSASWPDARHLEGHPASVIDALTRDQVVHIAAHGNHRADNPLFSSLLLHGGALFAHELEGLPLRASLVVLSACGAGRARVRPGDEALGLTASLLALGVRAVVAPLTDVPDALACKTMAGLHQRLAAGMDGPTALAAAGPDLLARSFTWFGSHWRSSSTP